VCIITKQIYTMNTPTTQDTSEKPQGSPFEEVKSMTDIQALNILIQAANAAQGAGVLSVRDSVFVAAAAELLTKPFPQKSK